jgi:hypothetical protein
MLQVHYHLKDLMSELQQTNLEKTLLAWCRQNTKVSDALGALKQSNLDRQRNYCIPVVSVGNRFVQQSVGRGLYPLVDFVLVVLIPQILFPEKQLVLKGRIFCLCDKK